jgi:hypothetical protein
MSNTPPPDVSGVVFSRRDGLTLAYGHGLPGTVRLVRDASAVGWCSFYGRPPQTFTSWGLRRVDAVQNLLALVRQADSSS